MATGAIASAIGVGTIFANRYKEDKKDSKARHIANTEKTKRQGIMAQAEEQEKTNIANESVRRQKAKARQRTIYAGANQTQNIYKKYLGG